MCKSEIVGMVDNGDFQKIGKQSKFEHYTGNYIMNGVNSKNA